MNPSQQHGRSHGDGLRDAPQAAEYLSISVRHLRELQRRGEIACVRFGARVLFTQDDLDAAIERARVTA